MDQLSPSVLQISLSRVDLEPLESLGRLTLVQHHLLALAFINPFKPVVHGRDCPV